MKQGKIPPRPAADSARNERPAVPDDYVPVPLRARHDGWTPDRQLNFIEALAHTACVTEAAKAVGLSKAAAYKLRARPDAQAFRLAWDAAIDFAMAQLVDTALGRAIHCVPVPIFHQGEQVGERREFDEWLAMFLMAAHAPERFGRPRQSETQTLLHFDYHGLMLAKTMALLAGQAPLARPGAYPDDEQVKQAAEMLGIDPDPFLEPDPQQRSWDEYDIDDEDEDEDEDEDGGDAPCP